MPPDDTPLVLPISEWVEQARHDPQRYHERQATEVLLAAIGASSPYGKNLYLKGGVLMGILYRSPRQTADIDFTADLPPTPDLEAELRELLDTNLKREAARLGYPGLVCRVQRMERKPRRDWFEDAKAPALEVTIGYAQRGSGDHKNLEQGRCSRVLNMEISFNEPVQAVEVVRLGETASIHAYSYVDLVAEKLRALIQQKPRGRNRRQDVYDLAFLMQHLPPTPANKREILAALHMKAVARDVEPVPESLSDPEIRERAKAEWGTLELEVSELPDFDRAYETVEAFYRSLPWS